ncbi:zinc-ribbon domain-containing protein [Massilia sp. H-1]|nr:zinc-ribbon domain-containing protein [Massilia sp. H-1]
MALATRCPHCKTTFRVASDQLKLRGGIVRCGTCNQVFDGNATLVDLDAPQTIMGTPPAPEIPAWLARTPAPVAPPPPAPETPALKQRHRTTPRFQPGWRAPWMPKSRSSRRLRSRLSRSCSSAMPMS